MSTTNEPNASLAEEARRLADALGLTAATREPWTVAEPRAAREPRTAGEPRDAGPHPRETSGEAPAEASAKRTASAGDAGQESGEETAYEHPTSCSWCPLCRGIESIREVDPGAVDRLAEAVGALAAALSEVGMHLRERVNTGAPRDRGPNAARAHGAGGATGSGRAAYDIPVLDDDLRESGDDDEDDRDDWAHAADEEE